MATAAAKIPNDQLDSLVAPIALYPDPLLAQALAASTYPHWPTEFQNPLFEVAVRSLREGHAPYSLGTLAGFRGVGTEDAHPVSARGQPRGEFVPPAGHRGRQQQILFGSQTREYAALLRTIADAQMRNVMGGHGDGFAAGLGIHRLADDMQAMRDQRVLEFEHCLVQLHDARVVPRAGVEGVRGRVEPRSRTAGGALI